MFFSMLLVISGALRPSAVLAQFTISDKPQLVRYEYVGDGEPFRATEIKDVAHVNDWGRLVSATLLSSGQMRFVMMYEIDRRDNRRIETIINDKGQKAEFRRAPDSDLTDAERTCGVGVLTISGLPMKITPEDAETATVRREVSGMLSAWDPDEREALEILYARTTYCGLHVGMGVLLRILFVQPPASGCEPEMLEARPDPKRDQEFLTIVPELAEWLNTPARLMTKASTPR